MNQAKKPRVSLSLRAISLLVLGGFQVGSDSGAQGLNVTQSGGVVSIVVGAPPSAGAILPTNTSFTDVSYDSDTTGWCRILTKYALGRESLTMQGRVTGQRLKSSGELRGSATYRASFTVQPQQRVFLALECGNVKGVASVQIELIDQSGQRTRIVPGGFERSTSYLVALPSSSLPQGYTIDMKMFVGFVPNGQSFEGYVSASVSSRKMVLPPMEPLAIHESHQSPFGWSSALWQTCLWPIRALLDHRMHALERARGLEPPTFSARPPARRPAS